MEKTDTIAEHAHAGKLKKKKALDPLTNLHNPTDFAGPGPFPYFYLHPALEIITEEICGDSVDHVNLQQL